MKIKVDSKALHKIMTALLKVVPTKSPLPILDNFLISINNGILNITSSDTEIELTAELPLIESDGNFMMAIPAKIITGLISTLTAGELTIEYNPGETSMKCIWENGNSVLPVFDPNDFPIRTKVKNDAEETTFSQSFLKDALIKTTAVAEANEALKPMISGIYFDIKKNGTTLVGTDSHMLTCVDCDATGTKPFILPNKASNMLKNMLGKGEDVKILNDENAVEIIFGSYRMNSAIVKNKFPKYENVIPNSNPNVLNVARKDFTEIVRRIMVCANSTSKMIILKLTYNEMSIIGQDLGYQLMASETINCDYDGEDIEIGFKATSLLQILSNIESDNIEIRFLSSNKASLITPSEEHQKNERVRSVIMPQVIK